MCVQFRSGHLQSLSISSVVNLNKMLGTNGDFANMSSYDYLLWQQGTSLRFIEKELENEHLTDISELDICS